MTKNIPDLNKWPKELKVCLGKIISNQDFYIAALCSAQTRETSLSHLTMSKTLTDGVILALPNEFEVLRRDSQIGTAQIIIDNGENQYKELIENVELQIRRVQPVTKTDLIELGQNILRQVNQ